MFGHIGNFTSMNIYLKKHFRKFVHIVLGVYYYLKHVKHWRLNTLKISVSDTLGYLCKWNGNYPLKSNEITGYPNTKKHIHKWNVSHDICFIPYTTKRYFLLNISACTLDWAIHMGIVQGPIPHAVYWLRQVPSTEYHRCLAYYDQYANWCNMLCSICRPCYNSHPIIWYIQEALQRKGKQTNTWIHSKIDSSNIHKLISYKR